MAIQKKSFPPGIHAPSFTFFGTDDRQQIDWDTQDKHLTYLVESGVSGIIVAGTCGEAAALTVEETKQLTSRARELASKHGRPQLPITTGCLGNCTRDVLDRIDVAHANGADFALVLPPAAFAFAMDQAAIVAFFREVADKSPLPILIYNFPAVVNGLNLGSDALAALSRHDNIVAVKLTCGGIAKAATVAAQSSPDEFAALAGQADWLLPVLSVGGIGCVAGVANLFPRTLIKIWTLCKEGNFTAAGELQRKVSKMEVGFAKGGLNGSKWIISKMRNYPDDSVHCRRPLPEFTDPAAVECIRDLVTELMPVEKELESTST